MGITFRSVSTVAVGASPRTVTKPTGTAEGDTLFLHVALTDDIAPTVPDGFTLVPGAEITGTNNCRVYSKAAGASEPANYSMTFASGNGALGMMALTGAATVSAHAVAVRTNGASGNRVWDGVTNTVENTFLACFGAFSVSFATTPPGGSDERYDQSGTPRLYLMTEAVAATGDTGTRTATGSTVASKCVTVSLMDSALTAPANLVATTVSGTQIDLTWDDNNAELDGISIERSPGGAATWAEIDTVAAGVEAYSDTGLDTGTTYDYRIRAFTL